MPSSHPALSDTLAVNHELAYYLQADGLAANLLDFPALKKIQHTSEQYLYILPLGSLSLLEITLYLPATAHAHTIEQSRIAAIKSALEWHKRLLSKRTGDKADNADSVKVLVLDIQLIDDNTASCSDGTENKTGNDGFISSRLSHHFGAAYFMETLILDLGEQPVLQIFSWQGWQNILSTLQTPNDIWRFLDFHSQKLQESLTSAQSKFESEQASLAQFINSEYMFKQAITVDNALIKAGLQEQPNTALVAIASATRASVAIASVTGALAQPDNSERYLQHMQQAATLWSQLSTQMIEQACENLATNDQGVIDSQRSKSWHKQLLAESLFSRHELVRALYQHPKQSAELRNSGYVVHQHSYESLGRHYVLIFYGQAPGAQQNKALIEPNLQKIAQDVATRLPLAALHHIIVLGIAFVPVANDTFIDIDLWIQSVSAMTQKERQLTKQLQRLNQQHATSPSTKDQHALKNKQTHKNNWPTVKINLTIPLQS